MSVLYRLSILQLLQGSQIILLIIVGLMLLFSDAHRQRIKLTTASLLASSIYVVWRLLYTLPSSYTWLWVAGVMLLTAEICGLFEIIPFYMVVWKIKKISVPIVSKDFIWPTVDIFIATYNEPISILYKTAYACSQLIYPDTSKVKVYLCDDGHRYEVAMLAEKLGVGYLTRPDNKGAKAGNLNNALRHTDGQLIVTFDADMIPNSSFLIRTVPFMQNRKVGFVQVPQSFYNEDIFQYNTFLSGKIPNEQDFFSHIIQSGRAEYNAIIYAGSNTLFRRYALESIGGFLEGTITEDFATGMLLQSNGWKSRYLDEKLVVGLSPETFEDVLNQRIRWGRGVIQTFKRYNPMKIKGLSLSQKILYLSSFTYWFFGIYKFIYFTAPLLYATFGWVIFIAQPSTILSIWLTQFLVMHLVFNSISGQYGKSFWRNAFDTALFPQLTYGVLRELFARGTKINFKVTPKDRVKSSSIVFKSTLVITQMVYLVLSVIGIVHLSSYINWDLLHYQWSNTTNDLVSLFWILYNMAQLVVAVIIARERPRHRNHDRFTLTASVQINRESLRLADIKGTIENISEGGVAVVLDRPYVLPPDELFSLTLAPVPSHILPHWATLNAKIVSYESKGILYRATFTFVNADGETYQKLLDYIYDRINIIPFIDGKKVGYFRFFAHYFNEVRRLKNNFRLSRKSPRIILREWSMANKSVSIRITDVQGNSLPLTILNVNSSCVLVEGAFVAKRLSLETVFTDSRYVFPIRTARFQRRNRILYNIEITNHSEMEEWILRLHEVLLQNVEVHSSIEMESKSIFITQDVASV